MGSNFLANVLHMSLKFVTCVMCLLVLKAALSLILIQTFPIIEKCLKDFIYRHSTLVQTN